MRQINFAKHERNAEVVWGRTATTRRARRRTLCLEARFREHHSPGSWNASLGGSRSGARIRKDGAHHAR